MDSSVLQVCCRVGYRLSGIAGECRGDATEKRLHAAVARHKSACHGRAGPDEAGVAVRG